MSKSKKYGESVHPHDYDLSQKGQFSYGEASPPRLCQAILHADAGFSKNKNYWTSVEKASHPNNWCELSPPNDYKENIRILLTHVYERLDIGLNEAWESSWGYDGDIVDSPDENWARLFAEMFIWLPYGGVAVQYGTSGDKEKGGLWDMEYVHRLSYGVDDPVYAFVVACQHMTNYGVVTRGFPSSVLGTTGTTASGGTASTPCFSGDRWIKTWSGKSNEARKELSQYRAIKAMHDEFAKRGKALTPGSVIAFSPPGVGDIAQLHIGMVLRIWDDKQYQPMDTGAIVSGTDGGTQDHEAYAKIDAMDGKMVGIGALDPIQPSKAVLDFMATARPLGFATFVFVDESHTVRFVSRVLPMYHGSKGFAVSRYAWSLRYLPAGGWGYWIISIPKHGNLSRVLREAGARNKSLKTLLQDSKASSTKVGDVLKPVVVLHSTKDGGSRLEPDAGQDDLGWKKKEKGEFAWNGLRSGVIVARAHYLHNKWNVDNVDESGALERLPVLMRKLKFKKSGGFADTWFAMGVDEEYTAADPPVSDVTKGLTYFDGNLAAPAAAAPAAPPQAAAPPAQPSSGTPAKPAS